MWATSLRSLQEATAIQAPVTMTIATAPRYPSRGKPHPCGYGHCVIALPNTIPMNTRAQSATRSPRVEGSVGREREGLRLATGDGDGAWPDGR
jgi:hypothetical protein